MSTLRKSLLLSFAEKYSVLLINIGSTVILARLLTPAETGLYSVAAGIINIAQSLRDFGVTHYVVQEEDLTDLRLRTALGFSVGMALVATGIFISLAQPLADFYSEPRVRTLVLIMSLSFIGVGFASIGLARLRRKMDFQALMRIGIAQTVVHATTSVVLASLGYGAIGMAWASVLGIWTGAIGAYFYFPNDLLMLPSFKAYRRVMDYGIFASGASMLQDMSTRAPDIIIGRLQGFGQAGLYSRGNGLITLLEQALMSALTSVAVSAIAALNRVGDDTRTLFLRFMGSTTAVAWPFLGMMAMLALPIIRICFGSQWLAAVPVAQVLCVGAAFQIVGQMGAVLFLACGKVRHLLVVQIISVPVQLLLIAAGALFNIEAAATGVFVSNLVLAAISLHQVNRVIGPVLGPVFRELGRSGLITVVTMVIPALVHTFHGITIDDLWGPSLVAGFGGVASWIAIIFLLHHPLAQEILMLLKKFGVLRLAAR